MSDAPNTDAQLHRIAQKLDGRAADGIVRLRPADAKFVADIVERWAKRGAFVFSAAQRSWLEDLEDRYL